ncbi:hypothetical protein LWI29_002603 [Acer saccharum]|uniref:Uncharacterized protein n=1 Tax=Acer saccharum TaxID=4024 RepID=A0AA39VAT1_ACESA|nr:hypothetical protein LWI29_002603 [Acer saccharum]
MMSDLEERERAAFASDPSVKALEEEERIAKQLKEEIERKRATMLAKKESPASSTPQRETKQSGGGGAGLDKEKSSLAAVLLRRVPFSASVLLRCRRLVRKDC